jgi:hypothetical protein
VKPASEIVREIVEEAQRKMNSLGSVKNFAWEVPW